MRISDWSSDVCSSDLQPPLDDAVDARADLRRAIRLHPAGQFDDVRHGLRSDRHDIDLGRSEEHTSELPSLMRLSYAVFGWKKKINIPHSQNLKHTKPSVTTTYHYRNDEPIIATYTIKRY